MGWDRFFYYDVNEGYEKGFSDLPCDLCRGESITVYKTVNVPTEGEYYVQLKPSAGISAALCSPKAHYAAAMHGDLEEVIAYFKSGENTLAVELTSNEKERKAELECRLFHIKYGRLYPDGSFKSLTRVACNTEIYSSRLQSTAHASTDEPDLITDGYTPGAGAGFMSYGRFGFSKGDGVLDYSMPAFGIISRPFITGNPKYTSETMWHFSVLPEGECESGSTNEVYKVPGNESISCDWTHTRWQRNLAGGKYISYDYSTISPALSVETNLTELRLSRLSSIGAYERISLPLGDALITRPGCDGLLYSRDTDGELSRGYVMLSHSGRFPEVPLLVSLPRSPREITRTEDEIRIAFDGEIGEILLGFPYGIELFDTKDLTKEWYADAADRIDAYHKLILMRPVRASEFFKVLDGRVDVITKYEYRRITDSFGSVGRRYALIPPLCVLASMGSDEIRCDTRAVSLDLPTKYGPLVGVADADTATYSMPVPDHSVGIPFSSDEGMELGELLHSDFDEFLEYHSDPTIKLNPGAFSFIFQYSFVAKLFPYLKDEDKAKLISAMREGLGYVSDPDYRYTGPEGRRCVSWYTRTEPFTGLSFMSTYLHVTGISKYSDCDRATIEGSDKTFIEVDWGNAMAIYGAYLGAMLSCDWSKLRSGYEIFRRAFDYYLVSMDWACMSAAYAENGQSWCDGTNYGAYIGFLGISHALGMHADENIATYAFAKLVTMRIGSFVSTQKYFAKYLGVEPWRCMKFIQEETDGSAAFLSYLADSVYEGYRKESFYNLTTEGHYREAWSMYASLVPEETRLLLDAADKCCQNMTGPADVIYHTPNPRVLGEQETYTYLMLSMLTKRYPFDTMLGMIREARENRRISRGMLGSDLSHRRVPREWTYASLIAELVSGKAPRLSGWYGVRIERAVYPEIDVLTDEGGYIDVSSENAVTAKMNGAALTVERKSDTVYRIHIKEDGRLTLG